MICLQCQRSSRDDHPTGAALFLTLRHGTMADEVGSKFGYACPACRGPVCVDCLALRGGYPCAPDDIERHSVACPRCRTRLDVMRFDHASGPAAARDFALALAAPAVPPGTRIPYAGHTPRSAVAPRTLACCAFGPRPRPLLPGDSWESAIHFTSSDGASRQLTLRTGEQPALWADLYLSTPDGPLHLGQLEPERVYHDHTLLEHAGQDGLAAMISLSYGTSGLFVANLHTERAVTVEKLGVLCGTPRPAPRSLEGIAMPGLHPTDEASARGYRKFDEILRALTARGIWDYMWLEGPRPTGPLGKGVILALAGSTDLMYYDLIRVVFKGVRYQSLPLSFSHPDFRLAPPGAARQLRALATFGPRSRAVCVSRNFGDSLEDTAFVVCDFVFVIDEGLDRPYKHSRRANVDWWLQSASRS